jgi:hypothetical protein
MILTNNVVEVICSRNEKGPCRRAEEKSPLDACLETVLPGVHQWHHANNAVVSSLCSEMKTMNTEIKEGIQKIVGELKETRHHRSDQDMQLAALMEMGRQILSTGKPIERLGTTINNNNSNRSDRDSIFSTPQRHPVVQLTYSPTSMPMNVSEEKDAAELEEHKKFTMKPKQHKSVVDLLSEWIDVGDYQDKFGGIEGRNKKFGASWRKRITPFAYSQMECTVKGIG